MKQANDLLGDASCRKMQRMRETTSSFVADTEHNEFFCNPQGENTRKKKKRKKY